MDINGFNGYGTAAFPYAGTSAAQLPVGYGMALTMNEASLNGYASLTESEKEEVILRCKDARTREQMQEIVDSLVPGMDVQEVYEEEKESFS